MVAGTQPSRLLNVPCPRKPSFCTDSLSVHTVHWDQGRQHLVGSEMQPVIKEAVTVVWANRCGGTRLGCPGSAWGGLLMLPTQRKKKK